MGIDFLKRTAKTFRRSWDRGKRELERPCLFDREVLTATRTVTVSPVQEHRRLDAGKEYIVRSLSGTEVGVYDRTALIARGTPPVEVVAAIDASGGVALGLVTAYHPLSGQSDLEVR